MHDVVQDLGKVFAAERRLFGHEFVKHHAQTEQIRAMVEWLSEGLLGTHVTRCTHDAAFLSLLHHGRRPQGVVGFRGQPFGQAEIQHLDLASLIQADVGRLDIPVHDPAAVSGVQGIGDLDGQINDLRDRQASSFFQDMIQRSAFDEFHGNKRQAIVGFTDVVHDADVRMIEG
jgi:hypothetical protein